MGNTCSPIRPNYLQCLGYLHANRHNWADASPPLYLMLEISSFQNAEFKFLCTFLFLKHKMVDKVQPVSSPNCNIQLSECSINETLFTCMIQRELRCMKTAHALTKETGFLLSLNRIPDNWKSILLGTKASEPFYLLVGIQARCTTPYNTITNNLILSTTNSSSVRNTTFLQVTNYLWLKVKLPKI